MKRILVALLLLAGVAQAQPYPLRSDTGVQMVPTASWQGGTGVGGFYYKSGGSAGFYIRNPDNSEVGPLVIGGGSGTVTSIAPGNASLTFSPNPIVGTGTILLNVGNANTWTAAQTFNTAAVIFGAGYTATGSGNFDGSGSSGTWKPPTGGLAAPLLLNANIGITGTAGNGALALGTLTGDTALPTGATSWTGASNKALLFTGAGASGTIGLVTASIAQVTIDGGGGVNLKQGGTAYLDVGLTTAAVVSNNITGIGTAQTVAFSEDDTSPAALNAQQFGGVHEYCGNGWSTTNSASRKVCWDTQVRPIQGAANPTGAWDFYENVNGSLTKYFSLLDTSTFESTGTGTFTIQSDATTGTGSAVALKFLVNNATTTSGDLLMQWKNGATEFFSVKALSVTSGPEFFFSGDGNGTEGQATFKALSTGKISGITVDNTATASSKKWNVLVPNNSSGPRTNGDFEIYDQTDARLRMFINASSAAIGDGSDMLSNITASTLPGSSWDVVAHALTTGQGSTLAMYSYTASTSGSKSQYPGCFDMTGHQWDNNGAADNYVSTCIETEGVNVAAAVPQVDLVMFTSVSSTTTRSWGERARVRSRIAAGFETSRLSVAEGSAVVAGDFALSAGWGNTATIGSLVGSDGAWDGTVTAQGTGIAANPTITFTYHDLGWQNSAGTTAVPVCQVRMRNTSDAVGQLALVSYSTTATVLTITFNGTPVPAKTYNFSGSCTGTN